MKENKTKMKAMGEDNSRSWAWIIFILIVFFVSLAFAVKPSNETSSYFEATGDMTGQIKVKGVQLKIYQDTGEGYKDVTKDGFDLDTNYFVTDRSYNYDMIIKNDDKATVKAEEYYLRWWFTANIDGQEYDITDYCSVDTAFVYKQDDSDGKTRFYSVNGYNSNVISAQTQLTFLSHINFKGQYDISTGEYGSILDKEASGSKVKITAHIEGSLSAYPIVKPTVKVYDSEGNVVQETTLADGQTTITLPRVGYGSKEIDGETVYFQGWTKNGVVAKVYTPNETVEVNSGDVFTPLYAQDPDYSDFIFTIDSVTGEYILSGANESMTSVTIPALRQGQVVAVVKNYAFEECYSLQTVEMPQTITKIGNYAFAFCSSLTSITIPDSVTEIGDSAFRNCSKLATVTLGSGITHIDEKAFEYCKSLTSVTIPASVTYIGRYAFATKGAPYPSDIDITYLGAKDSVEVIHGYSPDFIVYTIHCQDGDIYVKGMCFYIDTEIDCWDEKRKRRYKKKLRDLTYDDDILVWDFDRGCFATAKAMFITRPQIAEAYTLTTFSDGTVLKTIGVDDTKRHRLFNVDTGKFEYIGTNMKIGTRTFNSKGEIVTIVDMQFIREKIEYMNVLTKRHFNVFANGILTSNRFSNMYEIKNMRYVKTNKIKVENTLGIDDEIWKEMRLDEVVGTTYKIEEIGPHIEDLKNMSIDR